MTPCDTGDTHPADDPSSRIQRIASAQVAGSDARQSNMRRVTGGHGQLDDSNVAARDGDPQRDRDGATRSHRNRRQRKRYRSCCGNEGGSDGLVGVHSDRPRVRGAREVTRPAGEDVADSRRGGQGDDRAGRVRGSIRRLGDRAASGRRSGGGQGIG